MVPRRHSDENRVRSSALPVKARRRIDWYRRRATQRKLLLLECGIVRHAPFAECGRTLWELMIEQSWFHNLIPSVGWIRAWKTLSHEQILSGKLPEMAEDEIPLTPLLVNGHQAIMWLEQFADDGDSDLYLMIERYFHGAEWSAEATMFERPEDPDECRKLQMNYGVAYWLDFIKKLGLNLWNILDYYLGGFPGHYYTWASALPFHSDHRSAAIRLIECILARPIDTPRFNVDWRTADVMELAVAMYESRDFTSSPVLADHLEEAGCDNTSILNHCRSDQPHCRGCWVVDLLLGKA